MYVCESTHQHDYSYMYMKYASLLLHATTRTHRQSNLAPTLWGILPKVTTTSFSSLPPVEILADAQIATTSSIANNRWED